jgi:hypothetical protein
MERFFQKIRQNDGNNWALVSFPPFYIVVLVLEYLLKTGSDKMIY